MGDRTNLTSTFAMRIVREAGHYDSVNGTLLLLLATIKCSAVKCQETGVAAISNTRQHPDWLPSVFQGAGQTALTASSHGSNQHDT